MHRMCFAMLTPMLYISVCRKIYGVIRGKGKGPALHVAVLLRPPAPAHSCRSAAGTAGVSGRLTGGACGAAALAAVRASPPWVPRPSRGGAGPPPLRPAPGRPRAGGGGEEGGGEGWVVGGVPRNPPLVPWRRPPTAAGWRPGGSCPGGPAADGGGALFPRPPPPFECQTLLQALAQAPCSPRCRGAVPAGQGGGGGGECWGRQRGSAVSG